MISSETGFTQASNFVENLTDDELEYLRPCTGKGALFPMPGPSELLKKQKTLRDSRPYWGLNNVLVRDKVNKALFLGGGGFGSIGGGIESHENVLGSKGE